MKNLFLTLFISISTILTGQSWIPMLKAPVGDDDNFLTNSKGDLFYTAAGLYLKGNYEQGIMQLSQDTVWSKVGFLDKESYVISSAIDNKGNIYIYGSMYIKNAKDSILYDSRIAKWDGTKWSEIQSSKDYYEIDKIVTNSKGELYVIGDFKNFSKVTGADYIAKWDGAKWSKVGGELDSYINDIAIDKKDNVYIVGNFKKSGATQLNYIALLKNDTWSSLGKGCTETFWTNPVLTSKIDNNDNLWVGGLFDQIDGNNNIDNIGYWNGSKWTAGTTAPAVGFVYEIEFDLQNNPYLITRNNTGGGNTSLYTIKNNKYVNFFSSSSNNFNTIYFDKVKNRLYSAGYFPSVQALCYMTYLQLNGGVSTNDIQLGSNIKIAPNPFQNEIKVSLFENVNRISVSDAMGRLITSVTNPTNDIILSTDAWSNGVYFVTIEKDGRQFTTKMVK